MRVVDSPDSAAAVAATDSVVDSAKTEAIPETVVGVPFGVLIGPASAMGRLSGVQMSPSQLDSTVVVSFGCSKRMGCSFGVGVGEQMGRSMDASLGVSCWLVTQVLGTTMDSSLGPSISDTSFEG